MYIIIRYHFLSPSPCEHLVLFTLYPPLSLRVRKRERRHPQNKNKHNKSSPSSHHMINHPSHTNLKYRHRSRAPLMSQPCIQRSAHVCFPRSEYLITIAGASPCKEPSATSNQRFSTHKSTRASWEKDFSKLSSFPVPVHDRHTLDACLAPELDPLSKPLGCFSEIERRRKKLCGCCGGTYFFFCGS